MPETIESVAAWSAAIIETMGVAVILGAAFYAVVAGLTTLLRRGDEEAGTRRVRERLGRGILLGLEFLVAGDIIHTVAVELTFESVGVLAVVVLIRTFLSFTIHVELTGRWPWQPEAEDARPAKPGDEES